MNRFVRFFWKKVKHYDHEKYWKRRAYIQNHKGRINLKFLIYTLYIKKADAYWNASTGIVLGEGSAYFEAPPRLPHELNGIIIAKGTRVGKNATIFHQVTIGCDHRKAENVPVIGDNVTIYPGAKIFGKINIGDRVKIGPNAVVFFDVPSDTTVVAGNSYIIDKNKDN